MKSYLACTEPVIKRLKFTLLVMFIIVLIISKHFIIMLSLVRSKTQVIFIQAKKRTISTSVGKLGIFVRGCTHPSITHQILHYRPQRYERFTECEELDNMYRTKIFTSYWHYYIDASCPHCSMPITYCCSFGNSDLLKNWRLFNTRKYPSLINRINVKFKKILCWIIGLSIIGIFIVGSWHYVKFFFVALKSLYKTIF